MGRHNPGRGMETARVGHRNCCPAHGAIEQAHQIQMTEQGHFAPLGKPQPHPLGPGLIGLEVALELRNHRRRHHHVIAKVIATNPAMGTALKGAVGNRGRLQGPLQILFQPFFVHAAVQVIPGQGAIEQGGRVDRLRCGRFSFFKGVPLTRFHLAIFPMQAGFLDRLLPSPKGPIEAFPPGIHPRAQLPSPAHHRPQPAIAPAHKILHGRDPHIGEIRL